MVRRLFSLFACAPYDKMKNIIHITFTSCSSRRDDEIVSLPDKNISTTVYFLNKIQKKKKYILWAFIDVWNSFNLRIYIKTIVKIIDSQYMNKDVFKLGNDSSGILCQEARMTEKWRTSFL